MVGWNVFLETLKVALTWRLWYKLTIVLWVQPVSLIVVGEVCKWENY